MEMAPIRGSAKVYGYPGPQGYRDYVEGGLAQSDIELKEVMRHSSRGIGNQNFRGWDRAVEESCFYRESAAGRHFISTSKWIPGCGDCSIKRGCFP